MNQPITLLISDQLNIKLSTVMLNCKSRKQKRSFWRCSVIFGSDWVAAPASLKQPTPQGPEHWGAGGKIQSSSEANPGTVTKRETRGRMLHAACPIKECILSRAGSWMCINDIRPESKLKRKKPKRKRNKTCRLAQKAYRWWAVYVSFLFKLTPRVHVRPTPSILGDLPLATKTNNIVIQSGKQAQRLSNGRDKTYCSIWMYLAISLGQTRFPSLRKWMLTS